MPPARSHGVPGTWGLCEAVLPADRAPARKQSSRGLPVEPTTGVPPTYGNRAAKAQAYFPDGAAPISTGDRAASSPRIRMIAASKWLTWVLSLVGGVIAMWFVREHPPWVESNLSSGPIPCSQGR